MTIVRGLTFERWAVLITVRHCEYVGIVCGCVAKQSHQKVSLLVKETASFLAVTIKSVCFIIGRFFAYALNDDPEGERSRGVCVR